MRWTSQYRHDPRAVIDKYNIYYQTIARLKVKMSVGGSPCTYWKNSSIDEFGVYNTQATKCYCYSHNSSQPDPRHALCMGTGVLSGYQKYGYHEEVYASPSYGGSLITASGVTISEKNDSLVMSGNDMNVEVFTVALPLTRYKQIDRILVSDKCDTEQNQIEYYYSLDNTTWIKMTFEVYAIETLANKISIPITTSTGLTNIYFKLKFRKRYANSTSPIFYSMRFRYRNMYNLKDIAPRYPVIEPAFLADREQQKIIVEGGDKGWETKYPLIWWVLPEVNVSNSDIIQFHNGLYTGRKFIITWLERRFQGPEMIHTSTSFEAQLIRDQNELLGILAYLT